MCWMFCAHRCLFKVSTRFLCESAAEPFPICFSGKQMSDDLLTSWWPVIGWSVAGQISLQMQKMTNAYMLSLDKLG